MAQTYVSSTSPKTDDELISRGKDVFDASLTWQSSTVSERWVRSNNLYDSKFSGNDKERSDVLLGKGRLFIPKTYTTVQRILADLLDPYFADPEEVVGVAEWHAIPYATRMMVKSLLNYRLHGHPINFYEEAYEACLDALRNKVGIFKVYPVFSKRTRKYVDESGNNTTLEYQHYRPHIECLPFEDVFFSPKATWKNYWLFPIVHRMRKSMDYLRRRGYKNLDVIREKINIQVPDDASATDMVKQQRSEDQGSPFSPPTHFDSVAGDVYVYEIWDFLDVNGDGLLESCSYLMAGDMSGPKVVIRGMEENDLPYQDPDMDYNRAPIVVGQAFPESHVMYGKDLPEIMEPLQRETNSIRNQRREAVALSLRSPILVSRSANIDLKSLVNRRIGGVTMGDDISEGAVRQLETSDPSNSSLVEQSLTDQDINEATIPPAIQGIPSKGKTSATEVNSSEANGNKKIQLIIQNLAYTLFVPSFNMLLKLEQAYESEEFIWTVTGRKLPWAKYINHQKSPSAREIISGEFELYTSLATNRQQRFNRLVALADRAGITNQSTAQLTQMRVIQPQDAKFVNPLFLYERMLDVMGEKDHDDFLIQGIQPPQQPPMEGQVKGVASQPRMSPPNGDNAPTTAGVVR